MFMLQRVLLPALLLGACWARAQQGGDIQAQILYAFATEDRNSLSFVVQELRTQIAADSSNVSLRYHLAHAQYRMGLLAAGDLQAEPALTECVDTLKPVLKDNVKSFESLALQSACYSALAAHRTLEAPVLRSRSSDRLKTAAKLAPHNPRVVWLDAMDRLAQSKSGSAEHERAFAELQLAAQLFEDSSATNLDAPGWGHAEAYLSLARELKSRGDALGARNWTEKSLLAAPDYKAAQRQLALLARPQG